MERKRGNGGPKAEIRQMEIDDVAGVYHLGEQLFTSDEYPVLYRTWDPFEVTDHFTSDPEYCLVAEAEGKVVGFALATTIEKEGTAWKKYGYLSWIGIQDSFQRTGLGTRLYRRVEQKLRDSGARMIIADTDSEDREALGFFNRMGFSVSGNHVWLGKTLQKAGKGKAPPPSAPPLGPVTRASVVKGLMPPGSHP